jgi:tetratricopeptide (TPR) repeat protein
MTMGIKDRFTSGARQKLSGDASVLPSDEPDRPRTTDRLVVKLVNKVRKDETSHASDRKLKRGVARRNRRVAALSLATGPFAGVTKQVVDLYADTATVCELVALHRLELSDEEIAAHMLVLWSLTDDLSEARSAIEGRNGGVMAMASRRLNGSAAAFVPDRRSAPALVKAVWQVRKLASAPTATAVDVVRAGKPARDFISRAERQLGIERGRFGRLVQSDDATEPQLTHAEEDDANVPHTAPAPMTVDELRRVGRERELQGDLDGAEAAYREADERDDAEGALLLGYLYKGRGDHAGAADAFRRAEARGHPEAGSCLGNLLSDLGQAEEAKAAYLRAIDAGSTDAVLNLGLMLAQQGAADEALTYLRRADEAGDSSAAWAIGRLLEDRGDLRDAAAAYGRAADAGMAKAAFDLGAVLETLGDRPGARAAMERARDLGDENAPRILEAMDREGTPPPAAADTLQRYVAACGGVLNAFNACLEVANKAVGARQTAEQRPQHEISIRNFLRYAEQYEAELIPLYRTFEQACAGARDAAAAFLAAHPNREAAELLLAATIDEPVLNNVATVSALLTAQFGPAPDAFMRGLQQTNALIADANATPGAGNIYVPPVVDTSNERTCPWCAETIKAAAVICRFCGRDVNVQPA